ncbi:MAG: hypothetical protein ACQEUT_18035 [Bacillota bacterium]
MITNRMIELANVVIERNGEQFKLKKHRWYLCPMKISKQAVIHILETETNVLIIGED